MIEKKKGLVNGIIYNNTVYNDNNNVYFLNIDHLRMLIKEIKAVNETTEYIIFNPFYVNSKLNCQIEFDDYMFYMECRDSYTLEDLESHWTQCMDHIYDIPHDVKQYRDMSDNDKKQARTLYPLCKHGDYQKFHEYLNTYLEYLDELIPLLFHKAVKELNLSQDDMAFGYFCFEISSN